MDIWNSLSPLNLVLTSEVKIIRPGAWTLIQFSLYRFLWLFYDFEPDDSSRKGFLWLMTHSCFIRISIFRSTLAFSQDFAESRPWYSLFCSDFLLIFSYFHKIGIVLLKTVLLWLVKYEFLIKFYIKMRECAECGID